MTDNPSQGSDSRAAVLRQPGELEQEQLKIVIPEDHSMVTLLGSHDELLKVIEDAFDADIHVRGNEITVTGAAPEAAVIAQVFDELTKLAASGTELSPDSVERSVAMLRRKSGARPADVLTLDILSARGRTIRPKTLNQKRYVDAIDRHTIVFAIGPAGTGKTYLAMAKAVKALQAKEVNRIILTRPAVEAGERLGFLPGTVYEKIDPYLRPLYDALHDMVDPDSIPRLTAAGTIEIAPLAYMRGRAQPRRTPVLTPQGFRPIGELSIGDLVVGSAGQPVLVIGVYPQGETDVYRLTTRDGCSTLCSGDHLWAVTAREDPPGVAAPLVLTARELIRNLRGGGSHRYELPLLSAPVWFPEREVPVEPYTLGLLVGSAGPGVGPSAAGAARAAALTPAGAVRAVALTPADAAKGRPDRSTGAVPLGSEQYPAGGTLGSSEPPDAVLLTGDYLYNSAGVRLALLQGLLDARGEPGRQEGRIRYPAASSRLRDDVVFLVRSLGGVTTPCPGMLGEYRGGVDIRLPAGIAPFRDDRKLMRYRAAGADGQPVRFIDRIERVGRAETVCIAVAAADSLYVTEDFLLTHNTLNDSFILLDEAQNTSAEQMKMFLTRLGFGSKVVVTGDITQIDLPAGQASGLRLVQQILDGVEDVYFSRLTSRDVVRHKLVADIVDAYERWERAGGGVDAGRGPRPRRDGRRGR